MPSVIKIEIVTDDVQDHDRVLDAMTNRGTGGPPFGAQGAVAVFFKTTSLTEREVEQIETYLVEHEDEEYDGGSFPMQPTDMSKFEWKDAR